MQKHLGTPANEKKEEVSLVALQFIQKRNSRLLVFVHIVSQPHQVWFQDLNLTFVARKTKSWFIKRKTYPY